MHDIENLWYLMRDNDSRESQPVVARRDEFENGVAGDWIQPGGGFVKEHNLRFSHQGPGKGGPLDHSATDLSRVLLLSPGQSDLIQFMEHPLAYRLIVQPGLFLQRESDVLRNGEGVEKGSPLEEKTKPASQSFQASMFESANVVPIHKNTALIGFHQSGYVSQQHALAIAAHPYQSEKLSFPYLEGDASEDL